MFKRFNLLISLLGCAAFLQAQVLNLHHWRSSEKDSLNKALAFIDEFQFRNAWPFIKPIYNHHPKEDFIAFAYAKCAADCEDKAEEAFKCLNSILEINPNAPDIHFYLAKAAYLTNRFDEALSYMQVFLGTAKPSYQFQNIALQLKLHINQARNYAAHPGQAKITNLGPLFNDAANQVSPVISIDAAQIFYTECSNDLSGGFSANMPLGKILQSKSYNDQFQNPSIFKDLSDQKSRLAAISADKQHLLLIKENCGQNDIFISSFVNDKYSKPKKLKGQINSLFNENACAFSPDNKRIYFSSNRNGGMGGYDLYCAVLGEDSVWGQVKNLGAQINSEKNEDNPFLHADNLTLFFSSEGFETCGGYDVFKATYQEKDSAFVNRENLGFPINSIANDFGFVLSANGEEAYMSSDRKGGKGQNDIYAVEPNVKNLRPSVCVLKLQVEADGKAIPADIKIWSNNATTLYSRSFVGTLNMPYNFILPTSADYILEVQAGNFAGKKVVLDLNNMHGFIEMHKQIVFKSGEDVMLPTAALAVNTEALLSTDKKDKTNKNQTEELKPNKDNQSKYFHFQTFKTSGNAIGMAGRESSDPDFANDDKLKKGETLVLEIPKDMSETPSENQNQAPAQIQVIQNLENITDSAELQDRKAFIEWMNESQNLSVEEKLVKTDFVPKTEAQKRIVACYEKNANVSREGLKFRIQISANKENANKQFPQLKKLGKIEKMDYHDDFIRYTIGGEFKTYGDAFLFGQKVIEAGYGGIYIFGVIDGKRYKVEDLIAEEIFKP